MSICRALKEMPENLRTNEWGFEFYKANLVLDPLILKGLCEVRIASYPAPVNNVEPQWSLHAHKSFGNSADGMQMQVEISREKTAANLLRFSEPSNAMGRRLKLQNLPKNVLQTILALLPLWDQARACLVCKEWNRSSVLIFFKSVHQLLFSFLSTSCPAYIFEIPRFMYT